MTSNSPVGQDFWDELRRTTQARIGLGRTGTALPTRRVLELAGAHAAARDAVHIPLDVERLAAQVREIGIGEPVLATSRASSRDEYLRRPDLGRQPAPGTDIPESGADIGLVLADGLSPTALDRHGAALLAELVSWLRDRYTLAPPIIATQARVGLGDHLGAAARVRTLLVIIGERPGLSVSDSLGIYLTHLPRPGRTDADRNCISNIHPPDGLGYARAAQVAAGLVEGARALGRSGVDLKDRSRTEALGPPSGSEPGIQPGHSPRRR
ncbi:ethanolamine ammonia-lyase subunit EutC [Nocardioides sp. KC13]|uniref:Ethanolamine ammonia-lyase small subunit n=1 Tax=Nocardioides turkmenicus TaxID=2711220 RepID=A0A6M1R3U4_9ACTN|nr:ethanolamine ammonia-lyase subunit EutC [Nocardioides sp. KC13]NGN94362.1 ethanolamine ammonia-lyase subunit EutC [Nocardioides sp. KC13]